MQTEIGQDQIQAVLRQGQPLLIGNEGPTRGVGGSATSQARRQVALEQAANLRVSGQDPGNLAAMASEIQRHGEGACDILQPLDQTSRRLLQKKVVRTKARRSAVAVTADKVAVEDGDDRVHSH